MLNYSNFRVLVFMVTLVLIVNSSIRYAYAIGSDEKDNENSEGTNKNKNADSEVTSENKNLLTVAIIDAEITGSRLYFVTFEKTPSGSLVLWKDSTIPYKMSISNAKNLNENVHSITTILDEAKLYIPQEDQSNIPLVMRVSSQLKMKFSAEELHDIFDEITKLFNQSSFKITKNAVAVISDVDERRYIWFTVNFHLGLLEGQFDKTATALSLDDTSLEITFMPTSDGQNKKCITNFEMKGQSIKLYSRGYLGMGIRIARAIILAAKNGDGSYGTSPCYYENVKGTQYEDGQNTEPNTSSDVDYKRCRSIIETLVNTYVVFKPQDIYSKKIVAFSHFFNTAKKAKLVGDDGGDLTIQSFYDAAEKECGKIYTNNDVSSPFLCLDLTYIAVLLDVGFGFPLNTVFTVSNSLNGYDINWLLGAAHNVVEYGTE